MRLTVMRRPGHAMIAVLALALSAQVTAQSFGPQVLLADQVWASDVVLADLSGDGVLDVVIATQAFPAVAWLENLGQSTFGDRADLSQWPLLGPCSIDAADLDGDGDMDVVAGVHYDHRMLWFRNEGGGAFSQPIDIDGDAQDPRAVRVVDVNGDGRPDVLWGSPIANAFFLNWGLGGGAFSPSQVAVPQAGDPDGMAFADLDQDSDLDLIYWGGGLAWCENQNTGFGPPQALGTPPGFASRAEPLDVDGDGWIDLVIAHQNGLAELSWSRNLGGGQFATPVTFDYPGFGTVSFLASADVDIDGDFDLVAVVPDGELRLYRNATGFSSESELLASDVGTVRALRLGDLTGEGDDDLIYVLASDPDLIWQENLHLLDCNWNGVPDSVDIASGTAQDCNGNGIPDQCDLDSGAARDCDRSGVPDVCEYGELILTEMCYCAIGAPCGNTDPQAGCVNFSGSGARLEVCGSSRVAADNLVLTATNVQAGQFGLVFMGAGVSEFAFGNGILCVSARGQGLFRYPVRAAGVAGSFSEGPGLVAYSHSSFGIFGSISVGQTWNFQGWYRDPNGPCGSTFNLSNAVSVTFVP